MSTLSVDLNLLPHQREAFFCEEPHRGLVTGVGGGKTWVGARWATLRAITYPDGYHVATINTYLQGRDVVVPALIEAAEEWGLRWEYRVGTSDFLLADVGAAIHVRSTERFETLRGTEIDSWWGDEVRDAKRKALDVLWGRMRGRKANRPEVLWTTTPNGYDAIYTRFVDKAVPGRHRLVNAPSRSNIFLDAEYLDLLQDQYDDLFARQELGGEFILVRGEQVYRGFDRNVHIAEDIKLIPDWPIALCCDFNIDPHIWVVAQDIGPQINVLAEITTRGLDIVAQVEKFAQWRQASQHSAPFTVYGDATGGNRSGQTGRSWYDLLQIELAKRGLRADRYDVPSVNPPVGSRVLSVGACLGGKPIAIRFHPSCTFTTRDMEQCIWRDTGDIDKSDPERTHASDALGYFVHRTHPVDAFRRDNAALARGTGRM